MDLFSPAASARSSKRLSCTRAGGAAVPSFLPSCLSRDIQKVFLQNSNMRHDRKEILTKFPSACSCPPVSYSPVWRNTSKTETSHIHFAELQSKTFSLRLRVASPTGVLLGESWKLEDSFWIKVRHQMYVTAPTAGPDVAKFNKTLTNGVGSNMQTSLPPKNNPSGPFSVPLLMLLIPFNSI